MTDSGIDPSVAHPARIYDYWLGGKDNFAADRAAAEEVLKSVPVLAEGARANRAFLSRAVRYLVSEAGIDQFLDIGSGLPAAANTHEVARDLANGTRVVYVDNDATVATHARALLMAEESTAFVAADLRDVPFIQAEAARVGGMTLVVPGLVQPQRWRLPHAPDSKPAIPAWCGVGIKP